MKRTVKIIKNGEAVELEQGGEYIVGGKKYTVNIDFEIGKVTLGRICKDEKISADIIPQKLSLYTNESSIVSQSVQHKPVIDNGVIIIDDNYDCAYCLNDDIELSNIKFIKNETLQVVRFMKLIENAKLIIFKGGDYQNTINFLLLVKFAKNIIDIKIDNKDLGIEIHHYEDKHGNKKKSINITIDCNNLINLKQVFHAVSSLYTDDMEEVFINDEDGNILYTYYKFNSLFKDNSIFYKKSFIDYNNSLQFDAITINGISMDSIKKNIADFNILDFQSFLPFYDLYQNTDGEKTLSINTCDETCIEAILYIANEAKIANIKIDFKVLCDFTEKFFLCPDCFHSGSNMSNDGSGSDGSGSDGSNGSMSVDIGCLKYIHNISLDVYSPDCFFKYKNFIENAKVKTVDFHNNDSKDPNTFVLDSSVETVKNSNTFYRGWKSGDYNIFESGDAWVNYKPFFKNIKTINGIDVSKGYLFLDPFLQTPGDLSENDIDYEDFSENDKHFGKFNEYPVDKFLYEFANIRFTNMGNNIFPNFKKDYLDEYCVYMNDADKSFINAIFKASEYFNKDFKYYINNLGTSLFKTLLTGELIYVMNYADFENVCELEEDYNHSYNFHQGNHLEKTDTSGTVIYTDENNVNIVSYTKTFVGIIGFVFDNGLWSFKHPDMQDEKIELITWFNKSLSSDKKDTYLPPKDVKDEDKNVIYHLTKNDDGSIEITWENNSGIDAKFFTINDTKVLIPAGEG